MITEPTTPPLEQILEERTRAGNYFVSNYPPYSFWNADDVTLVESMLERAPTPETPLGVYVHIPFCRKRCHFCYFKVYTDKNASEVDSYIEAVGREAALYAGKPALAGRKPTFVYFGGGTPSYISSSQLGKLAKLLQKAFPWDQAREIAFECEPGTLTEGKLEVLKDVGITRLSLGIENFDETILKANGRAHGAKEIERAAAAIRKIGFDQLNIDLIAGMVGESWENWRECVRKTLEMKPESVTIYQMEVPYNTTMFKDMKVFGQDTAPVAGWKTKRDWVDYAFAEMEAAGYTISSAYTAIRDPKVTQFLYRDALWHGADMLGLGVAAFSHVQGIHFQNDHEFDSYRARANRGQLPLYRALAPNAEERLIREFILQMKLGHVEKAYFDEKFGVDVDKHFRVPLNAIREAGYLKQDDGHSLQLTREALLRVDGLLHEFFLAKHKTDRIV